MPHNLDVVIPFLRFEKELENELLLLNTEVIFKNSKIFLISSLKSKPVWAQDWWPNTKKINFNSKSEALKVLKSQKNLGVYYASIDLPLAGGLRKELRELKIKRIEYVVPSPFNFKYFSWTMLDNTTLLVCETPNSQFPIGWHEFNEDKDSPPNRAYLKLWEVLSLGLAKVKTSDIAIDLGSSPGGWTWVLSDQVKKVYSIDKAPLDKRVSDKSNVVYSSQDAFQVNPKDFSDCTFLFSDIICTPERLLELVKNWLENSTVQNYVCTIKFKGPTDFKIMQEFEKIENSKIIHLYHNKNEVTWIKQGSSS